MWNNTNSTRFAIGVVGNVISGGLFLSSIRTFRQIWKKKDVEALHPMPYQHLILAFNYLYWCYYGMPFITPNNILVATINGAGLIIELVYIAMFCYYASTKGRKFLESRDLSFAVGQVLQFAAIVKLTMTIPWHERAVVLVGFSCDFFSFGLFIHPLCVLEKVINTKSVKYMPFWLSLANFMNSCCWTTYALIGNVDYFILISNGLLAIVGLVQLIVYATYWVRDTRTAEDVYEDKCVMRKLQRALGWTRGISPKYEDVHEDVLASLL